MVLVHTGGATSHGGFMGTWLPDAFSWETLFLLEYI